MAETLIKTLQALNLQIKRQGGNATNWDTSGTTDYTESNVSIQAGSVSCTISSGNDAGISSTVTFPTAFDGIPLVVATIDDSNAFASTAESAFVEIQGGSQSASQISFRCLTRSTTVAADRTFNVHWIAIGKVS